MNDPLRPVSYSELATFRDCPMKHELAYRHGYRPSATKEPLRLGTLWHSIMEAHYTVIKEWQDAGHGGSTRSPQRGSAGEGPLLEACAAEVGHRVLDDLADEDRELFEWAYAGYVEQHGADPDWRILAIEIRGEVPLGTGERPIVFVIDLVVEDLDYGGVWIVDHKFPGDLASDTEIELDDQLGLYWYCWSVFEHGLAQRVNGAMLNEARKKRNVGDLVPQQFFANGKPKGKPQTLEQRFRRTRTQRTNNELRVIAADAEKVVRAMTLLAEHDALYSSPNPKQCGWKCDFKDAHVFSRSSGLPIAEVLTDFSFTTRAERAAAEEN